MAPERNTLGRAKRLEILNEVSRLATSTLDAVEMYRVVALRLQEVVGFDRATILWTDDRGEMITAWTSVGLEIEGAEPGRRFEMPEAFRPSGTLSFTRSCSARWSTASCSVRSRT